MLSRSSVGAQFILGSWYKKSELGTRAAVFCCFGKWVAWPEAGSRKGTSGLEMDLYCCVSDDVAGGAIWLVYW